ncbi:hypothetical protein L596_025151 [Steinernema carpocapsae]|uniref:Transmembrane protein n=2 Tax=Steinernema carpocapsae TaxID=34508 RepID=A0A4V5ZYQ5_STECR|nr:hypothetical protein L596_025151 [Steinernema carpocapsae]
MLSIFHNIAIQYCLFNKNVFSGLNRVKVSTVDISRVLSIIEEPFLLDDVNEEDGLRAVIFIRWLRTRPTPPRKICISVVCKMFSSWKLILLVALMATPVSPTSHRRIRRDPLSVSVGSITLGVVVSTAIMVGGAAVVSALITWAVVSDSDVQDSIQELCVGRKKACLHKLHIGSRQRRALKDILSFDLDNLASVPNKLDRWLVRLSVQQALKEIKAEEKAEEEL